MYDKESKSIKEKELIIDIKIYQTALIISHLFFSNDRIHQTNQKCQDEHINLILLKNKQLHKWSVHLTFKISQ